ncbi:MAG: hypothetical protein QF681_08535, partial [Vicinamibacterales bacterium]|nr:hypothetical protein [Vicinamibacterales bacterium]
MLSQSTLRSRAVRHRPTAGRAGGSASAEASTGWGTLLIARNGYCVETALRPRRKTYFWIFPVAVFGNLAT